MIFLLLWGIIGFLLVILFLPSSHHVSTSEYRSGFVSPTPQQQSLHPSTHEGSYLAGGKAVGIGYVQVSADTTSALFIGELVKAYQGEGTSLLADVLVNATVQPITMLLSPSDTLPLHLVEQTTSNLFPLTSQVKPLTVSLANFAGVLTPLSRRAFSFVLPLTVPAIPQDHTLTQEQQSYLNVLKSHLPCNQKLLPMLQTQTLEPLSCTPFIDTANVYVQNL